MLRFREVATPASAEDDVLIRLFASSVNPLDSFTVSGPLFFLPKLGRLKDLLEAGRIVPVIDRRYPLDEVAEALRYREDGHAQGKFVITIRHGEDVSGCDELQPFSTSKLGATEAPGRLLGITKP